MSEATLPTWHQTIDFNSLMVEARKHITELAGELWTDHNSSDPGITQLEVLAFCIADLSYRTSFDVKDVLTGYKGGKLLDIDLPLADVALPNAPVTINDLRKVLIDMVNPDATDDLLLRNVYPTIAEHVETPFYAVANDGEETRLIFDNTAEEEKLPYESVEEVIINGLYGLQVEFEDQHDSLPKHLKDLNQNYFEEEITVNGQTYTLSVLLPYWDEINWQLKDIDLQEINTTLTYRKRDDQFQQDYFIGIDKLNYDDYFYDYYAELDLNGHTISAFIKVVNQSKHEITVQGNPLSFSVNFLDWNELSNGIRRDYNLASPNPANAINAFERIRNVSVGEERIYDIRSLFSYQKAVSGNATINKDVYLLTRVTFDDPEAIDETMESEILTKLKVEFEAIYRQRIALELEIYTHLGQVSTSIYSDYLAKINAVFRYLYGLKGIWEEIGKHRNLCEDYAKFSASRIQEIALFGKIHAKAGVNPNELLGEIYFRVDEFLDPLIRFHTLSEMTKLGHSFQDIFNGPMLTNGFVINEDLEDLKRRSVIYTSDLIRIIMDVPGVLAVSDFNISSYIDNRLMGRNVINCLNLTNSEVYKPRFSSGKTKMTICVEDADAATLDTDIEDWYQQKLRFAKATQRPDEDYELKLELPAGQDRKIEAYRSIQHDFPEIYGIGEFGLPLDADDDRKSRAKQLKGFLLPFEQLLANYLKQVAHLPELFSFNRDLETTYATQFLYDIPDMQPLFSGFVQSQDTWDAFKLDIENTYKVSVESGESKEEFRSRRNRFLSQLIARFGESFSAYAEQMFDQHKHLLSNPVGGIDDYKDAQAATLDKLIGDKITFGEEYAQVTSGRYQAFDTTMLMGDVGMNNWQNDNIGDYKRRLCRLLGIEEVNNTFLFEAATTDQGILIDLEGMHILEHVLLRPRTSYATLMQLQNQANEDGGSFIFNANKDPYSFRITIVLPLNAGRFQLPDFRNFTERLIRMETPAHIGIEFKWLPTVCGKRFEAAYSAWKKGISRLKPWYFQNPIEGWKLPQNELVPPRTREDEFTYGASILRLQDNLINALNVPCTSQMQLFNGAHQLLAEEAGVIRFPFGSNDVFNIKLSHLNGKLSFYALNTLNGEWDLKIEDDTVTQSYDSVEEYTQSSALGLTEFLGGVGRYRVSYGHPDFPTLNTIIEVTPTPIPIDIFIGNKKLYLDFDTERDGVYKRSNLNWGGYFLEFFNYSERATITITDSRGSQEVIIPRRGRNKILFSDLYAKFGSGEFRIEYTLGDQTTFALIELCLELSITAHQNDLEQLPNVNQVTVLNTANDPTKFTFEVPNGTLTVTDLDATMPISSSNEGIGDEQLDRSPYVLELKKVANLSISVLKDKRFVPNHHYLFHYTKEGYNTSRIFKWEAPPKVPPTIDFFRSDVHINEDVVILDPKLGGYYLSLSPEGYDLKITTPEGAIVLQMDNVGQDDLLIPLEIDRFLGYSTNNFIITYGDADIEVEREFSVLKIKDPVVIPTIDFLINDARIDDDIPELDPRLGEYYLSLTPEGYDLKIWTPEGEIVFQMDAVGNDDLLVPLEIDRFLDYPMNKFIVTYGNTDTLVEREFFVLNSIDPIVDPTIDFLINDARIDEAVIVLDPTLGGYDLSLSPADFDLNITTPEGEIVLQMDAVGANDLLVPLEIDRFLGYPNNTFIVTYGNADIQASSQFSILKTNDPIIDPTIDFLINDARIDEDIITLDPKLGEYYLSLEPEGYDLKIRTPEGEIVLQMDAVGKDELLVPLPIDRFLGYPMNNFIVTYGSTQRQLEREFFVLKINDPVVDDAITVMNSMTEDSIGIVDDKILITFEFNNPKLFYTLRADHGPGELRLIDEDDNKQIFSVTEEGLKLEGHFLNSYTYRVTYVSGDYSREFFLDVRNPNPTFELQSIIKKGSTYTALGIPLYPFGKTYIWRMDGQYVSRAKQPKLTFDFKKQEVYEIEMTLHYETEEPSFKIKVTEELLQSWMNEK